MLHPAHRVELLHRQRIVLLHLQLLNAKRAAPVRRCRIGATAAGARND